MFEAFTWMFKKENFKKHFLYLTILTPVLYVSGFVVAFLGFMNGGYATTEGIIMLGCAILLMAAGSCLPSGYFYDMTEKIIDRETRYTASNVYDGKGPKSYFVFDLPDFNLFKHVWRGIASIVATTLMVLPYIILMCFTIFANLLAGTLCHFNPLVMIGAYIFYCLFFPALLWNYARTNSVFAVLNIFKAVNIIGNYTFAYIWRVLVFIIIFAFNYVLDRLIVVISGLSSETADFSLVNIVILLLVFSVIWLKNLYFWFVYAYLLGTLAPSEEA